MEEIEVPTEHLHEAIHHEAHHSQETWITWVALSTALLAALAAVTALLSGENANEAVIEHVTASDFWGEFQANGIKLAVMQGNVDQLQSDNKPVPAAYVKKIEKYQSEKNRTRTSATKFDHSYRERFDRHETLAMGVTMFQIAIAIAAISVLTKRRWFWHLGLGSGAIGVLCLIAAYVLPMGETAEGAKPEKTEHKEKTKADHGAKKPPIEKKPKPPQGESSADFLAPGSDWLAADFFSTYLGSFAPTGSDDRSELSRYCSIRAPRRRPASVSRLACEPPSEKGKRFDSGGPSRQGRGMKGKRVGCENRLTEYRASFFAPRFLP